MKKITILLFSLALVLGIVVNAAALPFEVDSGNSTVSLSNISSIGWTSLDYTKLLTPETFNIGEGQTQTMEFFSLTATGFGVGTADIAATLAFTTPEISTTGSGNVSWGTLFGKISGGTLTWNNLPDIKNIDGTSISIDFEDGIALVCGDTAIVHAYVTNLGGGGGSVSVPEPGTMLMLGFVLLGLVGVSRKRFNNRN